MRHTCEVRVTALLLVAATSCTGAQARTLHHTGEVMLAAGLLGILAASAVSYVDRDHEDAILEIGGAILVPVSLFGGLSYIATDAEVNRPHEVALTPEERSFNAAYEIAREAKHAARRGDCAEVQSIQPRVRELNERVYRKFLHDEIIRRCLAPETLPPVEPVPGAPPVEPTPGPVPEPLPNPS